MDNPPIPKPRKLPNVYENVKRPVPLPRIKESSGGPSSNESIEEAVILRNKSEITTTDSNEGQSNVQVKGIVKQIQENLLNASRQPRNKVAKSVAEGKKSLNNQLLSLTRKHNKNKKNVLSVPLQDRCVSMPETDTKLFDSIQFNSPIKEQVQQYDQVNISSNQSSSSGYSPNNSLSSDVDLNNSNSTMLKGNDSSASSSKSTEINTPQFSGDLSASCNSWLLYDAVAPSPTQVQLRNTSAAEITNNKQQRPSHSVMIEFDPLTRDDVNKNVQNYLNVDLLERLSVDNDRESTLTEDGDYDLYWDDTIGYLSPPTPPERLDSLFLAKNLPEEKSQEVQSKWFVNNDEETNKSDSNEINKQSKIGSKFSNMFKIVPESASYLKKIIDSNNANAVPIKLLLPTKKLEHHQGKMVRFLPGGIEEMRKKYALKPCTLADHKLIFYQENSNVKDVYNMKNFFSIQIILSHKFNYDGELHCFQINFSNLGTFNLNRGSVIFGCENETERTFWVRRIVESFSENFPLQYITPLTRFGWCYLKEGVSGVWDAAWILLSKRKLFYYTVQNPNVYHVDLRKARCIVLKESNEKKESESGNYILLDQQDLSLYLRMGASRETKIWHRIIKAVATNNGPSLHHQQLTKDNVPTIVDKCINFIYTQGSLSVGIYRKAGSNVLVAQLLTDFRADAWAVQLVSRTHSEHDVATALKRFFRDLPDSLLTTEMYSMFCAVPDISSTEEKVKKYKGLIKNLDTISQNTLKKLIGHLHFIQSLSGENCMTSLNLATVWGPTLLSTSVAKLDEGNMFQEATRVVFDLIENYISIYEPSESDMDRERKMLSVLRQCQTITNPIQKRSGDLHVWIYLFEKSAGNPVNIVLTPGRTSGDVCLELCNKVGKEFHLLMIEEVICGDSMSHPLHHSELLLDVVLRWSYWDEKDRCDNYLVLKENRVLVEATQKSVTSKSANLSMELKFANEKIRSFTTCQAECNDGILTFFKEKTGQSPLAILQLNQLRWYLGHESKRNPQSKWSITFIEKNKTMRTSKKPWFGCTIAGNTKSDQLNWIRVLLQTEYSKDLVPEPRLIIT